MDARTEFHDFLTSRRSRLTPEQAGLPVYGGNRRVPGLRREEVSLLAGMSVDYYVRLERGNAKGVSDSVLEALARALRLDEAERAHLFDLANAVNASGAAARASASSRGSGSRSRNVARPRVRPSVQRILDAMTTVPAYARNHRFDVMGYNRLGRALMSPVFEDQTRPPNLARFLFLDPAAREYYRDWSGVANDVVAVLRSEAGIDPHDKPLQDLVGELSTRSEVFRTRWATHNVRFHRTGAKNLHHPAVGDLDLTYDAMELPADPGLVLIAYSAEPGTPSHDGLNLLASWAATLEAENFNVKRPAAADFPRTAPSGQ
ncbi:helix-turn-helix transcriptional regulator [Actinospica sp.]|uniref:helix-turn-helix transcriptional regulator n=1 Tax=Actinospica sp. TaxID=1872142 RepID=UPI002BCCE52F|nr:helix-turn-helix transcriptional regulator [Actinospica sp.]HWG27052.1 helix-turn-helix transcriptional regulator [Actinospica sp.]